MHGIPKSQIQKIKDILLPFAEKIEQVKIFGSRATGKFRENSDVDLAIFGKITAEEVARINTLLMESGLYLEVQVLAYDRLQHPPLKRHIDQQAVEFLDFGARKKN